MGIVHVVLCACTCGLEGSPPQGGVWARIHLYIFSFPGALRVTLQLQCQHQFCNLYWNGLASKKSQPCIQDCAKKKNGNCHTWQQSWMCWVSSLDVGFVHMGTTPACQGLPPVLLGRDLLHRHHQQHVSAIPLDGGGWGGKRQSSEAEQLLVYRLTLGWKGCWGGGRLISRCAMGGSHSQWSVV